MNSERSKSTVESAALCIPRDTYDVAILGGGLAGLTLAIQIKQARPETSVLVLEKREGPAPLAAFKVGESTVAAGAHYFADIVGMRDHLKKEEIVKYGLRFFLPADGNRDLTRRLEKGPFDWPKFDNYQIDRGLFENKLAARARSHRVDVAQGARVTGIEVGGESHEVKFTQFENDSSTHARWVVDAAGRASLLKRKLGLEADSGHHINAAWFRLGGGFDLEQLGADDPAWMAKMSEPGLRQFSTNHLLGEGYWVWLIPLSSGPISIGVCADPRFHPFERINDFGRLLDWMGDHEPQLAEAINQRIDDVEDFLRVEDFSYGVKQAYSSDRWGLVGEAAAFADPFYSPGSDFIGYGNTFTTDLIVRDLDGEDISERADYFNLLYQRTFENVISRYRDTYPVFGNPFVCIRLLDWESYASHIGMTLLFVKNKITDLEFMRSIESDLDRLCELNINMHKLFHQWNDLEHPELPSGPPGFGPPGFGPPGGLPPGFGPPGGPPQGFPPGGPPPGFGPPGGPPHGFPPGGPPPGFGPPGGPPGGFPPGGPPGGFPPGGPPGGPPLAVRLVLESLTLLVQDYPDDDALRAELRNEVRNSEELAVETFRLAARTLPTAPEAGRPINPYGVGLEPDKWDADSLYDVPADVLERHREVAASVAPGGPLSGGPPAGMQGPPPWVQGGGPPPWAQGGGGGPPPWAQGAGGPPSGMPGPAPGGRRPGGPPRMITVLFKLGKPGRWLAQKMMMRMRQKMMQRAGGQGPPGPPQ